MASATRTAPALGVQLRVALRADVAIGPGKADLLEGVRDTGSIAAAGRRMGMSYKRAWHLVDSMNGCFRAPLVEAAKGGAAGGGARLTPLGEEVLARYRRMQARASRAVAAELAALARQVRRSRREP
jgi:molybdate transport system regulatory protein